MAGLLSLLASLGACDWFAQKELRVGESTVDDVRRMMGGPDTIREQADGSVIYEYPRGPEGTQTWIVSIDAQGKYRGMYDALTESNRAKVRPGMSREQVRELLGRPGETGRQAGFSGTVMSWRVQVGPGVTEIFLVELGPDDKVVKVDQMADPRTVNTR